MDRSDMFHEDSSSDNGQLRINKSGEGGWKL